MADVLFEENVVECAKKYKELTFQEPITVS